MNITANDWMAILPALLTTGAAMGILCLELAFRSERVRSKLDWAAYAGLAGAFYVVLTSLGVPQEAFSKSIVKDDLSSFVSIAVLAAAALAILQAPTYVVQRGVYRAEFYALVLLAATGMIFLAQANELITMFLSVELLSLSIYVLTGITRRDRRSNEAAIKYFVQGAFATGFLLYGMALLHGATGTVHLADIAARLEHMPSFPPLAVAGVALLIAGFAFKVGAAPFHYWVPDVYEGAPTVVTSFMSVAVKAAGIGALARIVLGALGSGSEAWGDLLFVVAILTMVAGNLAAIGQRSVKRMLAYSGVAHTGYALVGLASVSAATTHDARAGASSALFYVFVYTFMTLGAFAFLAWIGRPPSASKPHGEDAEDISDFAGLARRRPAAAAMMTVFMVSLAGVPPTAGFLGKFLLFKTAVDNQQWWLAGIGILTSIVSLYYYLRVVVFMYMHESEAGEGAAPASGDFNIGLAVGLCAFLTVLFGVRPGDYLVLAESAIRGLLR